LAAAAAEAGAAENQKETLKKELHYTYIADNYFEETQFLKICVCVRIITIKNLI